MQEEFSFSEFVLLFPDNESCLDEIKHFRYPKGVFCLSCNSVTKQYRVKGRNSFGCFVCRNQVSPLAGTIFEKSTTPLRLWFYSMYLMTHTRATISIKQLQVETGVTYKTAWRMYQQIKLLMQQNSGDLLSGLDDGLEIESKDSQVHKWIFFNKIEIRVAQKKEVTT